MPLIKQLTDIDAAVYRPWAWIEFPANANFAGLRINYPAGKDSKFRWLQDFRWSIQSGQGVSLEFSILEDRAVWNYAWPSIVKEAMDSTESARINCQWGYSARRIDGSGINGLPTLSNEYTSNVHTMFIKKMDQEYAEGGINYRFTAADEIEGTSSITKRELAFSKTFIEAVSEKILLLKKEKILTQDANWYFDPMFEQEFGDSARSVRRTWTDNGFPWLLTLQKWTSELTSRNNFNRKDFDKISTRVSAETIKGRENIVFSTSRIDEIDMLFELHVNPPESSLPLGKGKHTTLSIRPEVSMDKLWAMAPSVNQIRSQYERGAEFNVNSGDQLDLGVGQPVEIPSPSVDDPLLAYQKTEALRSTACGGSPYFAWSTIDVEILGMPELDRLVFFGQKYIYLIVWNTAYISDELRWDRKGLLVKGSNDQYNGLFDYRFTGKYLIKRIAHNITNQGSYTTTLSLSPLETDKIIAKDSNPSE